jgi:hypothetical protein
LICREFVPLFRGCNRRNCSVADGDKLTSGLEARANHASIARTDAYSETDLKCPQLMRQEAGEQRRVSSKCQCRQLDTGNYTYRATYLPAIDVPMCTERVNNRRLTWLQHSKLTSGVAVDSSCDALRCPASHGAIAESTWNWQQDQRLYPGDEMQ